MTLKTTNVIAKSKKYEEQLKREIAKLSEVDRKWNDENEVLSV
jgi:hypothetical protein